jgi:tol-pal system protein YbgF
MEKQMRNGFRWKLLQKGSLIINQTSLRLLLVLLGVGLPVTAFSSEASPGSLVKWAGEQLHSSKSYAVVIGINAYSDHNTNDLKYAVNDARSMAHLLKNLGYQITEDDVLLRSDPLQDDITKEMIQKAISKVLQKTRAEDRVIVFYAGHGQEIEYRTGGRDAYLLPSNYDPNDIIATALSFRDLVHMTDLKPVKAKHVLFILDACFAADALTPLTEGPGNGEEISYAPVRNRQFYQELLDGRAVVAITAGDRDQKVQEENGHGVFVQGLITGLSGAADGNGDGLINFNELFYWLEKHVYDSSGSYGQRIKTARLLPGNGQEIFIVPILEMREALLEERQAEKISNEPQRRSESMSDENDSPTALYNKALALLRDKGLPALARRQFILFMDNFPGSSLMPNVLYWLGETYYTEKRYERAIGSFARVIQMFPRHSKAPDALLKIGYCREKLNEMPAARFHLKELILRYPKSGSAKRAQTKLREWK